MDDLPKAAKDWPQINFVIYHSALRAFLEDPDSELAELPLTDGLIPVLTRARATHATWSTSR